MEGTKKKKITTITFNIIALKVEFRFIYLAVQYIRPIYSSSLCSIPKPEDCLYLNQYIWKLLGLKQFFTNGDCLICTEPTFWHCSSLFCLLVTVCT